ncbi:MAG TPA: MFS transporter [Pseudolabrys sp.]|uniref:MFS transporter n=1 Tax=Pseudolabrys sp. TaxID=1960880 RepID=UPI002DDD9DB3|nr:MFS transporter [Pseudolabrys sp.]HEV2630306.1 MFS transporter [Pseudolabrys sp.]
MSSAGQSADGSATAPGEERRAMIVACGAHALHDGFTDLIYVMLPVWQSEFGLSFAALGLMKTVFSGTLAGFQVPSGFLAERFGARTVLALGTALAGLGYVFGGLSVGVVTLVAALFVGGLGASTQHPLGSALVAQAFAGARSRTALGTYNFAGDLGKMSVPALASLLLLVLPWRQALMLIGALGVLGAVLVFTLMPRLREAAPAAAKKESAARPIGRLHALGFPLLLSVGIIDSATRMAFLTFLPFVLTAKGASVQTVGLSLTLVFAGGAAGKLVCTYIGARLGTIATVWLTEGITAVTIVALLPLSLDAAMLLLPVVGVALNGTSSVLYGSVPDLVTPDKRTRAFGIFYTGTIGAGAVSPALYGLIGDAFGVSTALVLVAAIVLVTLPLTLMLRPALAAQPT